MFLLWILSLSLSCRGQALVIIPRWLFLRTATFSLGVSSIERQLDVGQTYPDIGSLVLGLSFLPNAGCLACRMQLSDGKCSYLAVVDTGSPFLTAPPSIKSYCTSKSTRTSGPSSSEQYGATVGQVEWRETNIQLGNYVDRRHLEIGIVTDNLMAETGGIFLGLMLDDDVRSTFLRQIQYNSFVIDYLDRTLTLFHCNTTRSRTSLGASYPLYKLGPFGENLHHYAIQTSQVTITPSNGQPFNVTSESCERDIVVVIDTGLTGCVISESFEQEVLLPRDLTNAAIDGMALFLDDCETVLHSQQQYWYCSTIQLPWFRDPDNHPYIVAAGATFLVGRRLAIDASSRRYFID